MSKQRVGDDELAIFLSAWKGASPRHDDDDINVFWAKNCGLDLRDARTEICKLRNIIERAHKALGRQSMSAMPRQDDMVSIAYFLLDGVMKGK